MSMLINKPHLYYHSYLFIICIKTTQGKPHIAVAEHGVCADGDIHPDRTIQVILIEISKGVSEPDNPPENVRGLDVEESTKVD